MNCNISAAQVHSLFDPLSPSLSRLSFVPPGYYFCVKSTPNHALASNNNCFPPTPPICHLCVIYHCMIVIWEIAGIVCPRNELLFENFIEIPHWALTGSCRNVARKTRILTKSIPNANNTVTDHVPLCEVPSVCTYHFTVRSDLVENQSPLFKGCTWWEGSFCGSAAQRVSGNECLDALPCLGSSGSLRTAGLQRRYVRIL